MFSRSRGFGNASDDGLLLHAQLDLEPGFGASSRLVIEQSALRFLLESLQQLKTRDSILVNCDDLAVKNCRVQPFYLENPIRTLRRFRPRTGQHGLELAR